MPETFIVTITEKSSGIEIDLEIPSQLDFALFKGKLLEILRGFEPHTFLSWRNIGLLHNKNELLENDSLSDISAFDGSVLEVIRR